MLSSLRGRRLVIIGGLAVVAMAAASLMLMRRQSEPSQPPIETGRKPVARSDAAAQPNALDESFAAAGIENGRPSDASPEVPIARPDAFERQRYTYRSLGRLDPFESLVSGPMSENRYFGDQLNPEMIRLVGILEKNGERRALVEDTRGFGYVLKRGDRVLQGRVVEIGPEMLKIRHTLYGVAETMTLSLHRKSQGGFPDGTLR